MTIKKIKKFVKKHARPLFYVLIFLIIGSLLVIVRASSPSASIETENGSSNAIISNDSKASAGKYAQFVTAPRANPITYVIVGSRMLGIKTNLSQSQYNTKYKNVLRAGDARLDDPLRSVMDKTQVSPSGDKHDFYAVGPYFWPNPNTANGLPYINIDGKVNPEYYEITDQQYFKDIVASVTDLTTAYYYSGQLKYATKAEQFLNTWFIAPATKMNPNMRYTAVWKGKNLGSPNGILNGSILNQVVDSIKILQLSPVWTTNDQASINSWCDTYLTWLTSSYALPEQNAKNNHASWYEVQVTSIAEFVGNHTIAQTSINRAKTLINDQINADGTQPLELKRVDSWNYSNVNLQALADIAALGKHENIDLWNYVGPDGAGIHKALDYLNRYIGGGRDWKTDHPKDAGNWHPWSLNVPLRQAAWAYNNPTYISDADTSLTVTASQDYSPLIY